MKATMRLPWLAGAFAILASLASGAHSAPLSPVPPEPVQGPYLLVDAETGRVLDHHDALRPWFPASTSKLMSVYVAFRALLGGEIKLDSPVVYSADAAKQPPSKMGFKPGSVLTLDDALKVMMVKSANDIAVAVAETIGGSVDGFAARMNAEAQRLGMTGSHFVNPHGLPDPRQVTTARDMAILARALLVEFPQHRAFFSIPAIQVGDAVMENFNPLLERYPGANGMKTGFICASGYNLVASARRGEREMIAVVFGEIDGMARAEHAAALLDGGFQSDGISAEPPVTLANVSSGASYTSPADLRPIVCAPQKAAAASEANMQDASAKPGDAAAVSHLGPPVYLGPPIRISVQIPPADLKPGDPGFVARIPRPRPSPPPDSPRADVVDAFAPIIQAGRTGAASVQAIGEMLGGELSR